MLDLSIEQFAQSLQKSKKITTGWIACCPAHEDDNPSLSISEGNNGKILFHCHAGCTQEAVLDALKAQGLWHQEDLHYEPLKPSYGHLVKDSNDSQIIKKKEVAWYDYFDDDGQTLLYQVIRYEPKSFRQRRPDGQGGWLYSMGDVKRTIYRANQIMQAVLNGETIYIVEGEKDVHAAESLGLVATCNSMGADFGQGNKWLLEFRDYFIGAKKVVIIPDQDSPGEKHAQWVKKALSSVVEAQIVNVPKNSGKDLSDWISLGLTKDELEQHILKETTNKPKLFNKFGMLMKNYKPTKMLVENMLPENGISVVFGEPGHGKSFVALHLALCVATGQSFADLRVKQGAVFYFAGEGFNGLIKRAAAWAIQKLGSVDALESVEAHLTSQTFDFYDSRCIEEFKNYINQVCGDDMKPSFIVIDTLARHIHGNESESDNMMLFLNILQQQLMLQYQCHVMIVHHSGHTNKDRARGSSALKGALDAEFLIEKDSLNQVSITNTKQKDDEQWVEPKHFFFEKVVIEHDMFKNEDGEFETSVVLEHLKEPIKKLAPQDIEKFTNKEMLMVSIEKHIDSQSGASIKTQDIVKIGEHLELGKSTTERYIKEFVDDSRLFSMSKGHYQLPKNRICND